MKGIAWENLRRQRYVRAGIVHKHTIRRLKTFRWSQASDSGGNERLLLLANTGM